MHKREKRKKGLFKRTEALFMSFEHVTLAQNKAKPEYHAAGLLVFRLMFVLTIMQRERVIC